MLSSHFESQRRSEHFNFQGVGRKILSMKRQIVNCVIAIIFSVNLIFGLPVDEKSEPVDDDNCTSNGTHKEL